MLLKNNTEIQRYMIFGVKFIPPTNFSGDRIKITDLWNNKSKIFGYSYNFESTIHQAIEIFMQSGFKVRSYGTSEVKPYHFYISCDWMQDNDCIKLLNNAYERRFTI